MRTRRSLLISLLFLGSLPVLRGAWSTETGPVLLSDAMALTVAELDWQPTQREGVEAALLWGDPTKGTYAQLRRMPAGYTFPAHDHSDVERLVVIEGTYWVGLEEAPMKALGPGSFALLPPGAEHRSRCGEESSCLLLSERTRE